MRKKLSIKAGLDLHLKGGIANAEIHVVKPGQVAVTPDDYPGLALKASVRPGDKVLAGAPLLFDKSCPDLKVVSPAAGTVSAVVRGDRRKILHVVVDTDRGDAVTFSSPKDTDELRRNIMLSGLWSRIRQRPYDIVARPGSCPRDIFVTAFDSAPLASTETMRVDSQLLEKGVTALSQLTDGKVYICVSRSDRMKDVPGAVMVEVDGPHPAGNVGVQIANIAPVNKGETVWTLDAKTLENIGRLVTTGRPSFDTVVALTGPEVKSPQLIATVEGCDMASIVAGNVAQDKELRYISGNVLTGFNVGVGGYLRAPWRQITVIAEGNHADEFMGWASLSPAKLSLSRSFPSHFLHRLFSPDARINGSPRAMIMSGIYERLMPMDIMAEYLIKAILSKNIEQMEALGIYEVAPEDFALAEFADPSKLELQKIVADGLAWLRKELM